MAEWRGESWDCEARRTSQNKAKKKKKKIMGVPHGNGKAKKLKFLSGVKWFLLTLTLVFLICIPLSSPQDLLATFHNALSKQVCP